MIQIPKIVAATAALAKGMMLARVPSKNGT